MGGKARVLYPCAMPYEWAETQAAYRLGRAMRNRVMNDTERYNAMVKVATDPATPLAYDRFGVKVTEWDNLPSDLQAALVDVAQLRGPGLYLMWGSAVGPTALEFAQDIIRTLDLYGTTVSWGQWSYPPQGAGDLFFAVWDGTRSADIIREIYGDYR